MKTVEREHHIELHPETDAELKDLRIAYPKLWPFAYICVHKEFKSSLSGIPIPSFSRAFAPDGEGK